MQRFELTSEQIKALRTTHRKEPVKRNTYKINAVILLGAGWTLQQVSEALLLDEETLRTYIFKYKIGGVKVLLETIYTYHK